uniref:Uncharacterized protein n=1 Tax=Glossina pallidipes TaxID=7398 RepID=A0A1B0A3A7_GLOPL
MTSLRRSVISTSSVIPLQSHRKFILNIFMFVKKELFNVQKKHLFDGSIQLNSEAIVFKFQLQLHAFVLLVKQEKLYKIETMTPMIRLTQHSYDSHPMQSHRTNFHDS